MAPTPSPPARSRSKTPSPPRKPSPPPARVPVFISIYNVYDARDPCHWALFLAGGGTNDVILQVGDDKNGKGYYVENVMHGKQPQKSSMHQVSIQVGSVLAQNLPSVTTIINSTPVDNRSKTWNCQAWCVEALDALEHSKVGDFRWVPTAKAEVERRRQRWQ
ncbi:hypothetical protein VMCG_06989 [Cytospora schulzeri]|uniref:Uncharacterized protein n=1 Tax=Cytospora schulzeri TaxID=448051 RepID=A0A423W3Y5_9PEZI|nr:hypothetical protein VMCG_06989 [Valsa malicola]